MQRRPTVGPGSLVTLVSRTLVTLVSHTQLLWRGVTQGGVAPVFPFRASPYYGCVKVFQFVMVFIENPRSGTKKGGWKSDHPKIQT